MKFNWIKFYRDTAAPVAGAGGGETPEQALINKIKQSVTDEMQARGYANPAAVTAIVEEKIKDLPLDALRAYLEDKKKLDLQVRNIAAQMKKITDNPTGAAVKVNAIRNFLTEKAEDIKNMFMNKRSVTNGGQEIVFNVRAAAVMTTDNTIDEATHSIPVDMLESMSVDAFVAKRFGEQYIYQIADRQLISGDMDQFTTWLEEGSEQGAFAIVAEGATKPLVSYDLVRNFAEAKKVAGKYVVTEEFQKFRKNAYNIISRLIRDKLVRDYNAILTVDLIAASAGYTGTILDATIDVPNDYDAVGAVAAQIETLNFQPDVLIVHPQDKWRIRLSKDAEGRYLFPVTTENGTTKLLGLTVVTSTRQTIGTFTLGESGLFKVEEEAITIRMGYGVTVTGSNPVTAVVSDFDNNQLRIIVELFFKDWIATPNAGSFVNASFATVKAALLAP